MSIDNDYLTGVLVDTVNDFEGVRIAQQNRIRDLMSRDDCDPNSNQLVKLREIGDMMKSLEDSAVKQITQIMKEHRFRAFQQRYRGLGEKQFARLLGEIGDPAWNTSGPEPVRRRVSDLWSYCGYAVVDGIAPTRTRGVKVNWSPDARMRTYLIAENLMKSGRQVVDKRGPQDPVADYFRIVYDNAKAKYADAVHKHDCKRCGPSGKPAKAGSPLSDGHKHARALRAVSKELLRKLWVEAQPDDTMTKPTQHES